MTGINRGEKTGYEERIDKLNIFSDEHTRITGYNGCAWHGELRISKNFKK